MCHHATHTSFECKPLVAPIPAMTQSASQTSLTEVMHTFPLHVQMHLNSISIGVHQEVTSHKQCQQSPHTFQQDKIACCDLWMLPLLNGFNGPPTLHLQKRCTHICATSFVMQMQLGCPALDFPPSPISPPAKRNLIPHGLQWKTHVSLPKRRIDKVNKHCHHKTGLLVGVQKTRSASYQWLDW